MQGVEALGNGYSEPATPINAPFIGCPILLNCG